ncbi:MAG TPA: hypothetical protein VIL48_11765 [Acidimicrobiales bacterium]
MTKTTNSHQLLLVDTQPSWRLDERTRRVGLEGIARARAALQAGRRSRSPGDPDRPHDQPHQEPGVRPEPPAPVPHRRSPARRPAARRTAA